MLLPLAPDHWENAVIFGRLFKSYCSHCKKYIYTYQIDSLGDAYDLESAYYLTRLLLPHKINFTNQKIFNYKILVRQIKDGYFDTAEDFIDVKHVYFDDLILKLKRGSNLENIDYDELFDKYEKELERLKNTVYSINLGDANYNINLDGEKLAKDICPNCKNTVYQIDNKHPCPKCGGEMDLKEFLLVD